jgi:hypothetical protein
MLKLRYKAWNIEPQSYQSHGSLWHPKAVVTISGGGGLRMHTVAARTNVICATKHDADAYAVEIAKKWIDERDTSQDAWIGRR